MHVLLKCFPLKSIGRSIQRQIRNTDLRKLFEIKCGAGNSIVPIWEVGEVDKILSGLVRVTQVQFLYFPHMRDFCIGIATGADKRGRSKSGRNLVEERD